MQSCTNLDETEHIFDGKLLFYYLNRIKYKEITDVVVEWYESSEKEKEFYEKRAINESEESFKPHIPIFLSSFSSKDLFHDNTFEIQKIQNWLGENKKTTYFAHEVLDNNSPKELKRYFLNYHDTHSSKINLETKFERFKSFSKVFNIEINFQRKIKQQSQFFHENYREIKEEYVKKIKEVLYFDNESNQDINTKLGVVSGFSFNKPLKRNIIKYQYCIGKIIELPQIFVLGIRLTYPMEEHMFDILLKKKLTLEPNEIKCSIWNFESNIHKITEKIKYYLAPAAQSPLQLKFSKLKIFKDGEEEQEAEKPDDFLGYLHIYLPSNIVNSLISIKNHEKFCFDFSLHECETLRCNWIAFHKNFTLKYQIPNSGKFIALIYDITVDKSDVEHIKKSKFPEEVVKKSPNSDLKYLLQLQRENDYHFILNDLYFDQRNFNPDDQWLFQQLSDSFDWNVKLQKSSKKLNGKSFKKFGIALRLDDKDLYDNVMLNNSSSGNEKNVLPFILSVKLKTKLLLSFDSCNLKFFFK
eukprot:gene8721-669_t